MAKKPTPADAGRLARRAAEYLEVHEWTQGGLEMPLYTVVQFASGAKRLKRGEVNGVCLSGALNKTYCGNAHLPRSRVAKIPLLNLTHELFDQFLGVRLEAWNDQAGRTRAEVLQQLRKFADEHDPQRD